MLPLLFAACLPIPHRHIEQLGARFRVTDQAGRPVAGALVSIYEGSIIGSRIRRQALATTDTTGSVVFPTKRSWHWFVLLVADGEAPNVFGWCVEAGGHEAWARAMKSETDTVIIAPLLPATTPSHCPSVLDQLQLEQGRIHPRP